MKKLEKNIILGEDEIMFVGDSLNHYNRTTVEKLEQYTV